MGDIHLTRHSAPSVVADVARFFDEHRGARILLTGDVLDVSADAETRIEKYPAVARAMALHLDHGGEVFWVAGNHDASVGDADFGQDVADSLELGAEARTRLKTSPWFFRLGNIHLEHGHRFDADNAPAHPLAWDFPSLGGCFTEEFIVPTGAHAYLNANDGTPIELFLNSFRWYGPRAPYVIAKFFSAAASAIRQSGAAFDVDAQIREGSHRVAAYVADHGIDEALLENLRELGAVPTFTSRRDTFTRCYLDRVSATLALLGGGAAFALGAKKTGTAAALLGGALMAASWARGHDRYGGAVAERLAQGAEATARLTGDPLVVFGHAHKHQAKGGYGNPGSFAFTKGGPGRTFLEIENAEGQHPRPVLRHFA